MCILIIFIVLAVALLFVYAVAALIVFDVLFFVMALVSLARLNNAKNMKASKKVCPDCGSVEVKISREKTGVTHNKFFNNHYSGGNINYKTQRFAKCQDCGFDWPYVTEEDIQVEWASAKKSLVGWSVLCVLGIIALVSMFGGGTKKNESEKNGSVWLEGYTDISDFKYYIEGNEIYLTDFNSKEQKVRIASSYEIDGEIYYVVSLNGVFTLDDVTSVIIPEGVRTVAQNEFNSCGIDFLYLPSTLEDVGGNYFWNYFHNVEKIYYGGSEEQWNELCTVDRSDVDAKQIIYETDPDDLK